MKRLFLGISRRIIVLILWCPVMVQAQSVAPEDTLDVVNWNLEFFGDNAWELPEEMQKTKTIMDNLGADIYALVEIVNTDSLNSLVQSLNGSYNYIVSPYASFATTPLSNEYADAQKMAFVYRTSVVKNVSGRALMKTSSTAYILWASGRYPYLVSADVLGKDKNWRHFYFVILHAKANSDYSSCQRRYLGALEMKDTLDAYFANNRLVILGDFNDDLDVSICASFTESTYAALVNDSTDANSYKALTLPLSRMGISTISGYPGFIDHVVVSNEVVPYYVNSSAEMLKDKVTNWVTSFTSFVSDHYPVRTRYVMDNPTNIAAMPQQATNIIYPVPARYSVSIDNTQASYSFFEIHSSDGRPIQSGKLNTSINTISLEHLPSGLYFIRLTSKHNMIIRQLPIVR